MGKSLWTIKILTLFPEIYPGPLSFSTSNLNLNKTWALEVKDIKEYGYGRWKKVDDTPYGGGSGMIMRPDILDIAINDFFDLKDESKALIYMSPRGKVVNQNYVNEITKQYQGMNIICGAFEGIDQRVLDYYNITEVSIGDYIISHGDLAAFVLIDSCIRLLNLNKEYATNNEDCIEKLQNQKLQTQNLNKLKFNNEKIIIKNQIFNKSKNINLNIINKKCNEEFDQNNKKNHNGENYNINNSRNIKDSALYEESFQSLNSEMNGLLEYDQYTKPYIWKNKKVPDELISGHHQNIYLWRLQCAQKITKERRPDLFRKYIDQNIKNNNLT